MNEEHVRIVRQGAEAIRRWREENPGMSLDLRGSDLAGASLAYSDLSGAVLDYATLSGADLRKADLTDAILLGADLSTADLHGAYMPGANLQNSNLSEANLSGVNLSYADLRLAKLPKANLERASLELADLRYAQLEGALMSGATLGGSVVDAGIAGALCLGEMWHAGPSFYNSGLIAAGGVPDVFFRGIGVPQAVIDVLPAVRGDPIQRHSCFISYSHADDAFAERLYADLYSHGVPVWKDSHDLKIGDRTRDVVFGQIHLRDRTVVILSEASMASDWVESEVETAMARERQRPGTTVLFPLRIDDAIKNAKAAWAADLWNRRHVGDFTGWQEPESYATALEKVLADQRKGP